jgi:hypothetical protein
MAERTGCPILLSLWSYVIRFLLFAYIYIGKYLLYPRFKTLFTCPITQYAFQILIACLAVACLAIAYLTVAYLTVALYINIHTLKLLTI